jgi:hypothetical protein
MLIELPTRTKRNMQAAAPGKATGLEWLHTDRSKAAETAFNLCLLNTEYLLPREIRNQIRELEPAFDAFC